MTPPVPRRPEPRPGGRSVASVACVLLLGAAVLLAGGCGSAPGGTIGSDGLRVAFLTLTPTTGFPGPPTDTLTVRSGRELSRIARLVPARLPKPPAATPRGSTVCFPMDLTIGLSNGQTFRYASCNRPRRLLRVVAALCPLLDKPGFCFRFRNELG